VVSETMSVHDSLQRYRTQSYSPKLTTKLLDLDTDNASQFINRNSVYTQPARRARRARFSQWPSQPASRVTFLPMHTVQTTCLSSFASQRPLHTVQVLLASASRPYLADIRPVLLETKPSWSGVSLKHDSGALTLAHETEVQQCTVRIISCRRPHIISPAHPCTYS